MTYSQKANPNATNSELDAKVIITPQLVQQLTEEQFDELVDQFVEIQVDSMDIESLVQFVTETLKDDYGKFSGGELRESITFWDDELYDELVENIQITDLMKEVD